MVLYLIYLPRSQSLSKITYNCSWFEIIWRRSFISPTSLLVSYASKQLIFTFDGVEVVALGWVDFAFEGSCLGLWALSVGDLTVAMICSLLRMPDSRRFAWSSALPALAIVNSFPSVMFNVLCRQYANWVILSESVFLLSYSVPSCSFLPAELNYEVIWLYPRCFGTSLLVWPPLLFVLGTRPSTERGRLWLVSVWSRPGSRRNERGGCGLCPGWHPPFDGELILIGILLVDEPPSAALLLLSCCRFDLSIGTEEQTSDSCTGLPSFESCLEWRTLLSDDLCMLFLFVTEVPEFVPLLPIFSLADPMRSWSCVLETSVVCFFTKANDVFSCSYWLSDFYIFFNCASTSRFATPGSQFSGLRAWLTCCVLCSNL